VKVNLADLTNLTDLTDMSDLLLSLLLLFGRLLTLFWLLCSGIDLGGSGFIIDWENAISFIF
jgi:hypothetical protein